MCGEDFFAILLMQLKLANLKFLENRVGLTYIQKIMILLREAIFEGRTNL